jgi:ADP-heptose:LPS heptosyltransferase
MLKAKIRSALAIGIKPTALISRVAFLRILHRLPRAFTKTPAQIQRIFFSFPYHSVGDLILSLTLLDRIHDHWPAAEIDFAVGASMAPLVDAIPYVHRTFSLPRARTRQPWMAAYAEIRDQTGLFQREIAGTEYDLAIAPRWDSADSFFSAYLAYLTGAPFRCGYSGTSDGGAPQVDRLLTFAAKGGANEHESLRYTRLLGRCGLEPEDAVGEQDSQRTIRALTTIAQTRQSRGENATALAQKNYVVFSPGATNGRRMWPAERFAEVGRALHQRVGLTTIVIGSPADAALCQKLASSIGDTALSMAGKTDPLQMVDLIAGAKLFLGNDSGPAHIAGGLGIDTIVISPFPSSCLTDHPNSPQRFRPAGPRVQVLQPQAPLAPCSPMCQQDVAHCILQTSTEDVLTAVQELIAIKDVRIPATSDHPQDDIEA